MNKSWSGFATKLEALKSHGHTAVAIDFLLPYIKNLAAAEDTADPEAERQRVTLEFESKMEQYRAERGTELEMFKAVLETGQSALKGLSLINGGAAVAVLAFLGNVLAKGSSFQPDVLIAMNNAMLAFGFGVFFSGAGFALRYLSQASYAEEIRVRYYETDIQKRDRWRTWGNRWRNTAIFTGISSLVAFTAGLVIAYIGLPHH